MLPKRLSELSGPWVGWWAVENTRGHIRVRFEFQDSNINGGGSDAIGSFSVSGIFSDDTQRVLFSKQYQTHEVEHSGQWDGMVMYGKWTVHDAFFTETGEFELWPERELTQAMALSEAFGASQGNGNLL